MNIKFWVKKESPRKGNSYEPDVEAFVYPETIYTRLDPYESGRARQDCLNGTNEIDDLRSLYKKTEPVKVAVYVLAEVRTIEFPPIVLTTEIHRHIGDALAQPLLLQGKANSKIVGPGRKN